MRLLLDSHVALWWLLDDERLEQPARETITAALELWVSAATIWELSIKAALGKLDLPGDLLTDLEAAGARCLDVTGRHARAVRHLPLHHRDPFDRLLVAQAMAEGLTLVSADSQLGRYGVDLLPAR